MGSLSNLYISQSYQSLIHLGTDTGASGEPTQLQDGLGTNIGVYVNTNGEVSASSFSGSINGIGNVSAFSSSVNSRILAITGSTTNTGSLVTTSSFNAYTASQDFKNTTFATTSSLTNLSASLYFTDTTQSVNIASISTSVGLLQTFSGSQYKTDSASFDSRILAITSSGGIPAGTVSSSAQITAFGFATTGSNTFTAINTFNQQVDIKSGSAILFYSNTNDVPNSIGIRDTSGSFEIVKNGSASKVDLQNLSLLVSGAITASGNISSSGNIFAANLTGSTIDTGSLVTTASFNAYTASQDFKNTTFATTSSLTTLSSSIYQTDATQSINIASNSSSIGLLQTFSASSDSRYVQNSQTSSMAVSSSTYAVTASYALNAQTASQANNVVITARNGNQSTLGAGTVVRITGATGDNPIFNSSSYDTEANSSNTLGILRNSIASGADGEVVVNGVILGVNTDPALGYVAGDIIYLSASGQFTRTQPQAPEQTVTLGEVLRAQQNNGSIYVNISNGWELNELHNVQINTPLTNNILAYESSSYGLWKNKSFTTLGLATTGSNSFVGDQIITGSLLISSSVAVDLVVTGAIGAFGNIVSSGSAGSSTLAPTALTISSPAQLSSATFGRNSFRQASGSNGVGMAANPNQGGIVSGLTDPSIFITSGSSTTAYYAPIRFQGGEQYTDGRVTFVNPLVVSSSLLVSGTTNILGNQTITGSLVLSSSAAVELQVIGAVEITGSVAGNITALSVASSTASIDFNLGTFFTLTIPSSSVTYITGSNLKPGMTANIVLTQQSTTGSVRFESSLFKFPSGSINTGSAVASAVDIVSVMSVGTTTLYSVGANQLL
jgi:hypothetical protein